MFLFLSDRSLLSNVRLQQMRNWREQAIETEGSAVLFLMNDGFTTCTVREQTIRVGCLRPSVDRNPICGAEWQVNTGSLHLYRNWSGEFAIYYLWSGQFLCVTSHLKLLNLLKRRFDAKTERLEPGFQVEFRYPRGTWIKDQKSDAKYHAKSPKSFEAAVRQTRKLVFDSVAALPNDSALLLSGGIDSSAIAVAACEAGKTFVAYTFSSSGSTTSSNDLNSDLLSARVVAKHLRIRLEEILIRPERLLRNIRLGVFLCETPRGTIVDEAVALIEVAKRLREDGHSRIWMGEPADDLFGAFKFVLRYFRGRQLRNYLRRQIILDSPNELAILQNLFAPWGVSVFHGYWTADLLRFGYGLPLRYRVDPHRVMKKLLREAFRADLPQSIVDRPKCVPRDATGVRSILEKRFGRARERYRPFFKSLFGREKEWPFEFQRELSRAFAK